MHWVLPQYWGRQLAGWLGEAAANIAPAHVTSSSWEYSIYIYEILSKSSGQYLLCHGGDAWRWGDSYFIMEQAMAWTSQGECFWWTGTCRKPTRHKPQTSAWWRHPLSTLCRRDGTRNCSHSHTGWLGRSHAPANRQHKETWWDTTLKC